MKEKDLKLEIAKIQSRIMAYVMSILGGLIMFVSTVWLVLKGGENVGEHLGLLSNFFPGYSVSWAGSFVGGFYGFITGGIIGWLIGYFYFWIVKNKNKSN